MFADLAAFLALAALWALRSGSRLAVGIQRGGDLRFCQRLLSGAVGGITQIPVGCDLVHHHPLYSGADRCPRAGTPHPADPVWRSQNQTAHS
jgi:hypothetical protein